MILLGQPISGHGAVSFIPEICPMPAVPCIARVMPTDDRVVLPDPVPVIARLHWHPRLRDEDVKAWAVSTSKECTLVVWLHEEGPREDWLPEWDVRRPGQRYNGRPRLPWEDFAPLAPGVRPGPPKPPPGGLNASK
jgi:hypothetical protein